jgi:hypothetical protein
LPIFWAILDGVPGARHAFRCSAEQARSSSAMQRMSLAEPTNSTDQAFGHRTLFLRDPDLLEVFAEIEL